MREDGAAMRRWERLVCFPLHQDVEPAALEAVLRPLTERIGPASGRASALEPEAGGAPRHPSEV